MTITNCLETLKPKPLLWRAVPAFLATLVHAPVLAALCLSQVKLYGNDVSLRTCIRIRECCCVVPLIADEASVSNFGDV